MALDARLWRGGMADGANGVDATDGGSAGPLAFTASLDANGNALWTRETVGPNT